MQKRDGDEITIRNIGRIKEADMKLRGMTVVAGYNGTGKSTISKALYALLDINSSISGKTMLQRMRSLDQMINQWLTAFVPLGGEGGQDVNRFRREVRKSGAGRPMDLKELEKELCLIAEECEFTDIGRKDIEELAEEISEIQKKDFSYYARYAVQEILNDVFSGQINTIGKDMEGHISLQGMRYETSVDISQNQVSDYSLKRRSMNRDTAIYITTSDLVDTVGSAKLGITDRRQSCINRRLIRLLLSEPRDRVLTAEEHAELHRQQDQLNDILEHVVSGSIRTENGRLFYHDDWCNGNVELSNIASGMKLFIIIKRLIENGMLIRHNMLIIDEPENNLHPGWQLKIAELLVLMYKNMGIRIYCNSHSPYFIRGLEYFANEYDMLQETGFYMTRASKSVGGMYECEDVTDKLGMVYDALADPFDQIM